MFEVLNFFARDDFGWLVAARYGNILDFFNPTLETWFFRPVSQELYFWLNFKLWGFNALGFHLTTIFFHFVSVYLVYLIVSKLISKRVALLTCFLWGLNTIHYLSVLWVSGFTMSGAVLFMLLSFYLYLLSSHYESCEVISECPDCHVEVTSTRNDKYKSLIYSGLSSLSFLLALLSNESAYLFPLIIFAYEYFYIQKNLSIKPKEILSNLLVPLKKSLPFVLLNLLMLFIYFLFIELPKGEYGLTFNPVLNVKTFVKYLMYPLVTSFDRSSTFGLINVFLVLRATLLFVPVFLIVKKLTRKNFEKVLFWVIWILVFYSLFSFLPHHTYAYDSAPGSIGFFVIISYFVLQNKKIKKYFKHYLGVIILIQVLILFLSTSTDPDFLWLKEYSLGGKQWLQTRQNSQIPLVKDMSKEETEYSYYGNMYKFYSKGVGN